MQYTVEWLPIQCPYCWEQIEIQVEASAGDQTMIEDCSVCCRPITLHLKVNARGRVRIEPRHEDD